MFNRAYSVIHEWVKFLEFFIVLELYLDFHPKFCLFVLEGLLAVFKVYVAGESGSADSE